MKNKALESQLSEEILAFINSRKSLMLSSLTEEGKPYASYAPFAIDGEHIYLLLSVIAIHGVNLEVNSEASVLIVEDEDSANQLFARIRVNYQVTAELIADDTSEEWKKGVDTLVARHGEMSKNLSQLSDFRLFKLTTQGGRYVKGFGRAYQLAAGSLAESGLEHLRDGHKKKTEQTESAYLGLR